MYISFQNWSLKNKFVKINNCIWRIIFLKIMFHFGHDDWRSITKSCFPQKYTICKIYNLSSIHSPNKYNQIISYFLDMRKLNFSRWYVEWYDKNTQICFIIIQQYNKFRTLLNEYIWHILFHVPCFSNPYKQISIKWMHVY